MTIDPASGNLRWTPPAAGSYRVVIKADDGELSDTFAFSLIVRAN